MHKIQRFTVFAMFSLLTATTFAEEDDLGLVKAAENPLKVNEYIKHVSLPIENDLYLGYGPYNNKQYVFNFKPVTPFRLTPSYDLIIRTIAPLYERTPTQTQQGVINGQYINGWGDLNPTFFIAPALFQDVMWGLGPTVFIPTSTNNKFIGYGKWSIGPELSVIAMPDKWVFGILTYNAWSVAGDMNRPTFNQFSFEYFVSYNFPQNWFFTTSPTITANWKKPGNQQWTVPVGAGFGRAFTLARYESLNLSLHTYCDVVHPAQIGPDWQLQFTVEWILPPTTMG